MRKNTELIIKLLLIRHGSTAGNEEKKYIGSGTDESLSETGKKELLELKKELYGKSGIMKNFGDPEIVFASPMKRCTESAEQLFGGNDDLFIDFEEIRDFKEIDFGVFEGKKHKELSEAAEYREAYQAWIDSGGAGRFPEGEDRKEFIERTMRGFDRLVRSVKTDVDACMIADLIPEDADEIEYHAAAVVHGGTIMAIMSSLTELDYFDAQVRNASGYMLEFVVRRGEISDISYSRLPDGLHT